MSITIAEILRLPSMHDAKVVAGGQALERRVSTISVSEYTWNTQFKDMYFDYADSEIVISAFYAAKDSVEKQLNNIEVYHSNRVAGLILFYVGVILPYLDERVVSLAERLNFPIIMMPEGRPDLRYSEVIYEVVEAIIKSHRHYKDLTNDIIEQVSCFPASQRSLGFAMRILSNNTFSTIVLADRSGEPYHVSVWPRNVNAEGYLRDGKVIIEGELNPIMGESCRVYVYPIRSAKGLPLQAVIYKRGEVFDADAVRQIGETIQTAINLWGRNVGESPLSELVGAILRDEPYKIKRLSSLFRVDVSDIRDMWILQAGQPDKTDQLLGLLPRLLQDELPRARGGFIYDAFEESGVVMFHAVRARDGLPEAARALLESLRGHGADALLTDCRNLGGLERIRRAYTLNERALRTAKKIFPLKPLFTLFELRFADECIKRIEAGEDSARQAMEMLEAIPGDGGISYGDMLKTLFAYYLDADRSAAAAAELLFVHKNTIQYRIKKFHELIADDLGGMLEVNELLMALAIGRILESDRKSRS
ncbi:MAG TPA: PucR family transcriptional regulator ligand-binding domain-containing protein [Clostridia bacterium]|nr:PucR family transcriptional regulator ligand-binding domain-containing protein [Clostridia bacterium]